MGEDVTINLVADYYEVDYDAIESIIRRQRDELEEVNIQILKGSEIADIKEKIKGNRQFDGKLYEKNKYSRHLIVFPRRAVLRIGMLLRDSEVGQKLYGI